MDGGPTILLTSENTILPGPKITTILADYDYFAPSGQGVFLLKLLRSLTDISRIYPGLLNRIEKAWDMLAAR